MLGLEPCKMMVGSAPSQAHALTNNIFCNSNDLSKFTTSNDPQAKPYAKIPGGPHDHFVLCVQGNPTIQAGTLGFNTIQRRMAKLSSGDEIIAEPYTPPPTGGFLSQVTIDVDLVVKRKGQNPEKVDSDKFAEHMIKNFTHHVLTVSQQIVTEFCGINFLLSVSEVEATDLERLKNDTPAPGGPEDKIRGMLMPQTVVNLQGAQGAAVKMEGANRTRPLFSHDFNFEKIGIGGLDAEFGQIFRRAFASRLFPPEFVQKVGIQHVKGMLLYGPPGTGKTLIARQIGKMLNGKEPKVVNGPEVLNKYVGASEENIRKLFADAEQEYKAAGDDSDLHIIIFDELDAICKQRGSARDGTGVGDSVVNQLLSKIDGVDALNNILLIGMTNRKDMLDEALLRPGRLEVHVEIGLPDEHGRFQILNIHTRKMSANSLLASDVDLVELAALTKNYSGAEIEGVTKAAVSYAFDRHVDPKNLTKAVDVSAVQVCQEDFLNALQDVRPAFGVSADDFENCLVGGMIDYGTSFRQLMASLKAASEQVEKQDTTPLLSVLLSGIPGAGKTAIAAQTALEGEFPFVKLISPETMVGLSENGKATKIHKIFEDAYKSPLSVIVLDNLERLLEYVRIGPRFSNLVLQTLLILIKRAPPKGRRLFVIGTTTNASVLESLELLEPFNIHLTVPELQIADVGNILVHKGVFPAGSPDLQQVLARFEDQPVGIKKLLLLIDMATPTDGSPVNVARFTECMSHMGLL